MFRQSSTTFRTDFRGVYICNWIFLSSTPGTGLRAKQDAQSQRQVSGIKFSRDVSGIGDRSHDGDGRGAQKLGKSGSASSLFHFSTRSGSLFSSFFKGPSQRRVDAPSNTLN